MSFAVTDSLLLTFKIAVSESIESICCLNLICFKFSIISATSCTTPLIVENSCSTPEILIEVIA